MIETFKIITNIYDPDCTEGVFQLREIDTTRGHSKKIFKKNKFSMMKYSFPNRVVNNWNDLPEWVVLAATVMQFESRLDRAWSEQE